jgi:hypothetical protein
MKFYKIENEYGILIDDQVITTERSIEYITREEYILATGEDVPLEEVPFSITPAQGRMMLLQLGLLTRVKEAVENSTDEAIKIFFGHASSWNRDNIHITSMATLLEMTEEQTDNFFIEAKKI